MLYFAREYGAAQAQAQKTLELDSSSTFARKYLFDILAEQGKYEEAVEQHIEQRLRCPLVNELEGSRYADATRRAFAQGGWRGFLNYLVGMEGAIACISPLNGAEICALLGDNEQTLQRLEQANNRASFWILFVTVDPHFDHLQNDARLKDLLLRAKLTPATS